MKQEITELEINGIAYVPKSSLPIPKEFDGDIKIVILQRG